MIASALAPVHRLAVVVMGVSASGKSSVAAALAAHVGVGWRDADELHPPANVAKMSAGVPLDDADRRPWLDSVGAALAAGADGGGIVVACSALRRRYRDRLRAACPEVMFVHLHGTREVLASRAAQRRDHFMPASLLASQLATLEVLHEDEVGVMLDIAEPVDVVALRALDWIKHHEQ